MSGTAPTPATMHRQLAAIRLRTRTEIETRLMNARRRDTARNGYRGALTRAELGRYGLAELAGRSSQEN